MEGTRMWWFFHPSLADCGVSGEKELLNREEGLRTSLENVNSLYETSCAKSIELEQVGCSKYLQNF